MMRIVAAAALLGLALAAAGCATAVRGTSQTIAVGSTPEGASCVFTRDGQTVATVITPGSVTLKRERTPIGVVCTKQGHEEARSVMNSMTDSTSYSPLVGLPVVGVVAAVGSLADSATGSNNRYQTALMMKLEPLSAADLAAAGVTAAAVAAPTPAPARPTVPAAASAGPTPPATPASSPFDGIYQGDVELVNRSKYELRRYNRHIEVTVRNGVGTGTVKHPFCDQPGDLSLTIDAAGQVKGTANSVNTDGCVAHKATLVGRVDGKDMQLTITRERHEGWSTDFTLARRP